MVYDGAHNFEDGKEGRLAKLNPCKCCFAPGENGTNCIETFARIYIQAITICMLALSIVVMAFGISVVSGVGDSLDTLELRSPSMATLVFGAFMFTFAFVGFVAVTWGNFCMKVLFAAGSAFLTLGILTAGIYVNNYSSFLQNVGDLTLTNELEETILAYELAVFHECCDPANSPPLPCDDANSLPCVEQLTAYNDFLSFVGDRTCDALSNVFFDDVALVGVEPLECGEQDMSTFVSLLSQYLDSFVGLIGTMNITLGVVFLLLTISSIFLFYEEEEGQKKNNKFDKNDNDSFVTEDSDMMMLGGI